MSSEQAGCSRFWRQLKTVSLVNALPIYRPQMVHNVSLITDHLMLEEGGDSLFTPQNKSSRGKEPAFKYSVSLKTQLFPGHG
eukprot:scaffold44321_cov18-Tisochrysis_lutea.AAC.2